MTCDNYIIDYYVEQLLKVEKQNLIVNFYIIAIFKNIIILYGTILRKDQVLYIDIVKTQYDYNLVTTINNYTQNACVLFIFLLDLKIIYHILLVCNGWEIIITCILSSNFL